ncbi:MAG: hypothetical protein IT262_22795, partial [Saprospiraceae bacterium]|nr:hypothetical protein [Saprospiraceae bacterium]
VVRVAIAYSTPAELLFSQRRTSYSHLFVSTQLYIRNGFETVPKAMKKSLFKFFIVPIALISPIKVSLMKTAKTPKKKEPSIQEFDLLLFEKQVQFEEKIQKRLAKKPAHLQMPAVERMLIFFINCLM